MLQPSLGHFQNSRLAARLTGWRINIRDASAPDKLRVEAVPDVEAVLESLKGAAGGEGDPASGEEGADGDGAAVEAHERSAEPSANETAERS